MEIQRSIPVSDQLRNILLERIHCGAYSAGDRFPSESELCLEFGVSRATVRTALADLTARGLLVRHSGIGTFISESSRLESGLERLESVMSIARRQGLSPHIDGLKVEVIAADEELATRFGFKSGTRVTCITRSILVDGLKVSYHADYVPEQILQPHDLVDFKGSVLDVLIERLTPAISNASTEITAINAMGLLSSELDVPEGHALILLKETLFDEDGNVTGYSDNYIVPDRFRLQFVRRR